MFSKHYYYNVLFQFDIPLSKMYYFQMCIVMLHYVENNM